MTRAFVTFSRADRARFLASGAWTPETIPQLLTRQATALPDRIAVTDGKLSLTYAELRSRAARVARSLLGAGIEPGDRALFMSSNVTNTIVAFYGCCAAGVVPVCGLPTYGVTELTNLAMAAGAVAVVAEAGFGRRDLVRTSVQIRAACPDIRLAVSTGLPAPGFDVSVTEAGGRPDVRGSALPDVASHELALLQLSGGTTGAPKLIPRTHADYLCNARAWAAASGWGGNVVTLHAMPIMHNAGLVLALMAAHVEGGTCVITNGPGQETLRLLGEFDVTDMLAVSAVYQDLLAAAPDGYAPPASLRRFALAPFSPEVARRVEDLFDVVVTNAFGMGEGMCMQPPAGAPPEVRWDTSGSPVHPEDEARIIAPGSELELPVGEVGELVCRGPYTIRGYYNAPPAAALSFTSDGFYRTGDLARAHPTPRGLAYSIEGRLKDSINRGGEKFAVDFVEGLLGRHSGVEAIAIVAVPDLRLGETACAFVVPRGQSRPSRAEFAAILDEAGVSRVMCPERIEYISALPLTDVGKVRRDELRKEAARRAQLEASSGGRP